MYRIVLVDDEEIFLDYMRQAIPWEEFGCEITACCTQGEEALAYILSEKPDVVFMDVSIPRMNGLEVCARVRAANVPSLLVIMTAHDEFSFAYQAIKIGIEDYLLKPFTERELETALQKLLPRLPLIGKKRETQAEEREWKRQEKREGLIERIDDYIDRHYAETDLTIERIALHFQFENSYLRRVYKRYTGCTIAQKLDMVRICAAKRHLEEKKLLNREIASAVGYSDQYYFSKRFKQLCGYTPSDYRRRQDAEKR